MRRISRADEYKATTMKIARAFAALFLVQLGVVAMIYGDQLAHGRYWNSIKAVLVLSAAHLLIAKTTTSSIRRQLYWIPSDQSSRSSLDAMLK